MILIDTLFFKFKVKTTFLLNVYCFIGCIVLNNMRLKVGVTNSKQKRTVQNRDILYRESKTFFLQSNTHAGLAKKRTVFES